MSFGDGNHKVFSKRRRLAGAGLVMLVALCGLLFVVGAAGGEGITRGVSVAGVSVGGMSKAEAREALQGKAAPELKEIRFGESGKYTIPAEQLGIQLNPEQSVQAAYAVGHGGWFGERASETLNGYVGGVEAPASVSYDEAKAREAIAALSEEVHQEPENASYEVSGGEIEVVGGEPGRELDVEQTLANLEESLASMEGQVPLATNPIAPEKSAEELRSGAPTTKLGEFKTDYRYSDSEARRANLRMAAGAVNGTVLSPGETFSMNDKLVGLNYKEAKVFAEGGETEALGGGLCQVTSTVYMAAQHAGMEIVERHPHYTVLPYIRPGFDATVWFGAANGYSGEELDMRFKNNTDSKILIREYVNEKGFLVAEIWGQPTGKEVEMRSERDFKDTSRGIKWSTYKTVKQDGEVIREGLLYEDLYSFPPPESVGDKGYNDVRVGGWQ